MQRINRNLAQDLLKILRCFLSYGKIFVRDFMQEALHEEKDFSCDFVAGFDRVCNDGVRFCGNCQPQVRSLRPGGDLGAF